MQNFSIQEFMKYEGQTILVDPANISKMVKTQRRIIVFSTFGQPLLICGVFLGIFMKNSAVPSLDILAIAPYLPVFIFIVIAMPFLMFRVFAWMFPKRFDPIARTMISLTPIFKRKKDVSSIECIVMENKTVHSGRQGSQEFIYVNAKKLDGKTINFFRFPGVSSEEIIPHIKSLATSMGWKFEELTSDY